MQLVVLIDRVCRSKPVCESGCGFFHRKGTKALKCAKEFFKSFALTLRLGDFAVK
jgi:hypothetical protein